VFNAQVHRNLWLALATAAVLTVGGCSKTGTDQANNNAPQADIAKPAAKAKPVAAKHAVAKKAPQPTTMVTVPKGTAISATVGQTLATDKNKVGDTFAAIVFAPIQVDGKTVIPKGAKVTGRIVKLKTHELKVTLASVMVQGKSYDLQTNSLDGSKAQASNTPTQTNVKSTDKTPANKDITLLTAKSQLTFKLSKPVAIPVPVKG
jgi:glucose/arabinose dehydrogenase